MTGAFAPHVAAIRAELARTPTWQELCARPDGIDAELVSAILDAAAAFAEDVLVPLNIRADRQGCRLENGRVVLPDGYAEAWAGFVAGGWPGLDLPVDYGGQGLPLALQSACQQLFDRACPAFGMVSGSLRAAVQLLAAHADAELRAEWLPRLVAGDWAATICMSEAGAGSDVGRIRTRARRTADGGWRVTGEKIWISFGDHALTPRIGHCLLARPEGAPEGSRGLSLFLVPSTIMLADGSWAPNGITVARIEEKLGLHGSPTCVLHLDDAAAHLVGIEGRGLSQLFVMIQRMRLATAVQGLGLASGAIHVAAAYAAERRQGGDPRQPPVPIIDHADVRRMLTETASAVAILRALVAELSAEIDIAEQDPDPARRDRASDLVGWLLPIAKDRGGRIAFEAADTAIQVLGGAGYTREWPVEQILRDARILTIYEGTTGIQALDLLHRRLWRDEGRGLRAFAARVRAEVTGTDPAARTALAVLAQLEGLAADFGRLANQPREAEAGATALLEAAFLAASAWLAHRLVAHPETPDDEKLGRYRLQTIEAEMALASVEARRGSACFATAFV